MTDRLLAQQPLALGVVVRPHGVRGELRVHTYEPGSRTLLHLESVLLRAPGSGGAVRTAKICGARTTQGAVLLSLEGVGDRDAAESLKGWEICARRDALPALAPGEFYVADLVGCQAFTPEGRCLGSVEEAFRTAAHDVLVIRDGMVERLLPLVPELLHDADPAARRIVIEAPEGLPETPRRR